MAYLLRMIGKVKWESIDTNLPISEYPSHPVTSDLKTDNKNRLSLWRIEDIRNGEELENVAIALAVCRDKIDKVEIVLLPEDKLLGEGFKITNDVDSAKSLEEYNYMHRDIAELKFKCIGQFANIIVNTVKNDENCRLFTRKALIDMIRKRIQNNEISKSFFESKKEDMRKQLGLLD